MANKKPAQSGKATSGHKDGGKATAQVKKNALKGRHLLKETDIPDPERDTNVPEAIGQTIIWFQMLEECLSIAVSFLLRRGNTVGRIVTSELSFRGKVNLMGTLFRPARPSSSNLDELADLTAACLAIEERRNQVVHSIWAHTGAGMMVRTKFTRRAKRELIPQREFVTAARMRSIWVHCEYLCRQVDLLMKAEFGERYKREWLKWTT